MLDKCAIRVKMVNHCLPIISITSCEYTDIKIFISNLQNLTAVLTNIETCVGYLSSNLYLNIDVWLSCTLLIFESTMDQGLIQVK